MTQHMDFMDLSDEEEKDEEPVVGYVEVFSAASLGWQFKEFKDGKFAYICTNKQGQGRRETARYKRQKCRERKREIHQVVMVEVLGTLHPFPFSCQKRRFILPQRDKVLN